MFSFYFIFNFNFFFAATTCFYFTNCYPLVFVMLYRIEVGSFCRHLYTAMGTSTKYAYTSKMSTSRNAAIWYAILTSYLDYT